MQSFDSPGATAPGLSTFSAGLAHHMQRVVTTVTASSKRAWVTTFVIVLVPYLMFGHWARFQITDAQAAAWPAWWFVHHGTFFLDNLHLRTPNPWFLHAGHHVVSNRMPGVILAAVPLNVLLYWTGAAPETVGVLTAAVVTAAAVANMGLVIGRFTSRRYAFVCAVTLGLGTGLLATAGVDLWAHGSTALWLSFAALALTRERLYLAGAALAAAAATRPHLAVVAFAVACADSLTFRRVRPAAVLLCSTGLGLAFVVAWNHALFGSWSLSGGYGYIGDSLSSGGTNGPFATQVSVLADHVLGNLLSPGHGLFVYSPICVVALVGACRGWSRSPAWAKGLAVGGLAYLLVQSRLNTYNGGAGYLSNRLLLETVVCMAPMAALGLWQLQSAAERRAVRATATASVAVHVVGAICALHAAVPDVDPARNWLLWDVMVRAAPAGYMLGAVAGLAVLVTLLVQPSREEQTTDQTSANQLGPSTLSAARAS